MLGEQGRATPHLIDVFHMLSLCHTHIYRISPIAICRGTESVVVASSSSSVVVVVVAAAAVVVVVAAAVVVVAAAVWIIRVYKEEHIPNEILPLGISVFR